MSCLAPGVIRLVYPTIFYLMRSRQQATPGLVGGICSNLHVACAVPQRIVPPLRIRACCNRRRESAMLFIEGPWTALQTLALPLAQAPSEGQIAVHARPFPCAIWPPSLARPPSLE